MKNDSINYLVGNGEIINKPLKIYCDIVCDYLAELSKELLTNDEAKRYPDIMTFAFWCRKSNIVRLKEQYNTRHIRVGRGVVFHIAPSNVPINFAFSLVFGLLSGNVNIVRVSEKEFAQVDIVCGAIKKSLTKNKYKELIPYIHVVKYRHDKEITDFFSSLCDSRIIWGGDNTIKEIRKSTLPARSNEITFADRYSFAIIDEEKIENDDEKDVKKIAEQFYNDTYLMDQNACSSPHLVMWKASKDRNGRIRFWKMLSVVAQKYDLQEKKITDKFTQVCELVANDVVDAKIKMYSNVLYVAELQDVLEKIEVAKGQYGLFFETELPSVKTLSAQITKKVQTCVVYGVDRDMLVEELIKNSCVGIDRIVPIGSAMDIGVYWDGYDIVGNLSRIIDIQ